MQMDVHGWTDWWLSIVQIRFWDSLAEPTKALTPMVAGRLVSKGASPISSTDGPMAPAIGTTRVLYGVRVALAVMPKPSSENYPTAFPTFTQKLLGARKCLKIIPNPRPGPGNIQGMSQLKTKAYPMAAEPHKKLIPKAASIIALGDTPKSTLLACGARKICTQTKQIKNRNVSLFFVLG